MLVSLLPPVWAITSDSDACSTEKDPAKRERTGCLITEVVFPGFHWEDHAYLSVAELEKLWGGQPGWEQWLPFVKKDA